MRLALLTAVLVLVLAAPAAADTNVELSMQGNGVILDDADQSLGCVPSFNENAPPALCAAFTLPGIEARSFRALAATDPADHWEFDKWAGSGCASRLAGEPENVCIVGGPLAASNASPVAVFRDVKPPTVHTVTEIRPGPQGAVTFEFEADEEKDHGATFECWLDQQSPADCTVGNIAYTDIAPGSHTFYVRGTDASGQVSEKDEAFPFTIDAPPIPESPGPPVVLPRPTFPPVPRVLGPNAVTAKVSRKRTFSLGKVRLMCPAVATPCSAKATIKGRLRKGGKQVRLASKPLSLRPSSSTAVKLKLGRKVAAALRKRGRLKGVARLEIRAPDVTTRKDVAVTLRAPKKR